jgi:hypothetical protein
VKYIILCSTYHQIVPIHVKYFGLYKWLLFLAFNHQGIVVVNSTFNAQNESFSYKYKLLNIYDFDI